jgi:iron complex transport system substrate-binding protein
LSSDTATTRRLLLFFVAAALLSAAAAPQRIVSLSPNTTEILDGIGAFKQVVAVSRYCTYPAQVAKLPRVGGWQDASIESIAAQRPDLVVLTKPQEPFVADRLRAFGISWTAVPSQTLADVFTAIDQLGAATGHRDSAAELARRTRSSLNAVRTATEHLPQWTVVLVVSRSPGTLSDLYVATAGSYLVDLLQIAGGRSVTSPAPSGYAKLSKEALLELNPDVILDMIHRVGSRLSEKPLDIWNDLPELKAVKTRRVYLVDDEFVPHPSQFVAHTAQLFASILHPEAAIKVTP